MLKSIGIIGLGKLGLPLAILFARHFKVCGVDVNSERIMQILNREEFFEPHVSEYLEKYGNNLTVSTDYGMLEDCDVVFNITQTPSLPSGQFDLQFIYSAIEDLHKVNPDCLAVVSSTVNIGDIDKLKTVHERVAYNPEFIKQGSIIHDFENPKFVLIGTYHKKDGNQIANIWRRFHNKPIHIVEPVEVEIIKLSLNVSFTLGITFANMIGDLCERFRADSNKVLDIIYKDRRNYKAGLGYSGPCFPRDVNCFKAICKESNVQAGYEFSNLLSKLNDYTVEKYIHKIKASGKQKIGIVGIAYKPDVPYVYASQPLEIAQRLLHEGYEVYVYDVLAEQNAEQALDKKAHFCTTINECIKQAEIIFIGTTNYSKIRTTKPIINPWE